MGIINDNFLLGSEYAKKLYSNVSSLPIIDYHCHIPPSQIAQDRCFSDVTELFLGGDHYKWRAMRAFGIEERYITGDAAPIEKFEKYAQMLEYAAGNPLYHWTALELARVFGITDALTAGNAREIYRHCTEMLRDSSMSPRNLIRKFNVECLCTTDDPADSLEHHKRLRDEGFEVKVLPTYRPDKIVNIEKRDFVPYVRAIGCRSVRELCDFLVRRLDFFCENFCRVSDHGLDRFPVFTEGDVCDVFERRMSGESITERDADVFKTYMLRFLGKEYAKRSIVMQLHIGVLRNNNARALESLGYDSGFDSMDDRPFAHSLSRFLDSLDKTDELPKTVMYSLNPKDNYMLGSMAGNFMYGTACRGKIQHGSAWWLNDHIDGIRDQLRTFASLGVIGTFIGMLTDSRSLVSYTRHEYFRRILCDFLADMANGGLYPKDSGMLEKTAQDVSYYNALNYFGFERIKG